MAGKITLEIEKNIQQIVLKGPVLMANIPKLYKEHAGEELPYSEELPYKKGALTKFMERVSGVEVYQDANTKSWTVRPTAPQTIEKPKNGKIANNVKANVATKTPKAPRTRGVKTTEREGSGVQLDRLLEDEEAVQIADLSSFIFETSDGADDTGNSQRSLFTSVNYNRAGFGYLGRVESDRDHSDGDYFEFADNVSTADAAKSDCLYINTSEPFCTVCIGVQGAGKSHTMNVMLENCMLGSDPEDNDRPIISTHQPMSGLVLHFDQSQSNVCESVGLKKPAAELSNFSHLKVQRVVILVSPSFYKQRKEFYCDKYEVAPLLFDWASLSALQLRKLMRLTDTDSQLYVSTMLNLLRDFQRNDQIPQFPDFVERVGELCNASGQSAPLNQRLELLQNFVRDSRKNSELMKQGLTFTNLLKSGTLVVADLTDPMLSPDEACGVFQVLLEQFRGHNLSGVGKVVTFDEAHKYLNNSGPGCVELSNAIVDTVRLMRHEGMRVLISTQSPLTMPPELLELSSATILHRFQSADWCKYLASKVTLPDSGFERIKQLRQGQALLLSTHMDIPGHKCDQVILNVRRRLTLDLGTSRRNKVKGAAAGRSDAVERGHDNETLSEIYGEHGSESAL